jgi:hypothetical protein
LSESTGSINSKRIEVGRYVAVITNRRLVLCVINKRLWQPCLRRLRWSLSGTFDLLLCRADDVPRRVPSTSLINFCRMTGQE